MSTAPRRALVTGAASGIGEAIARRLIADGLAVTLLDVSERALADSPLRAHAAFVADLARPEELRPVITTLLGSGLDVLVNCAGIGDATPTDRLDGATFRRVMDVNLTGAVELTLGLLPALRASSTGRVVNIASIQGLTPAADTLAYATSKGALIAFSRALATDLAADGVLVNAVAPGFVDTPMARLPDGRREYETDWFRDVYLANRKLPLGRPARPDEIAGLVRYLVSEDNTYLTGQAIAIDGGVTATF